MNLKNTIPIFSIILLIGIVIILNLNGHNEESTRIIIRSTAQLSVILFCSAFIASSLHFFIKSPVTKKLVSLRPQLGLAFGTSHTFHLLALLYLQSEFHPVFTLADSISLFGGGTTYVLMYLMMITTIPKVQKSFPSWTKLHIVGSYWIWAIFFNSYLNNAINKEQYYGFLGLLILVIILRLAKFMIAFFNLNPNKA